jgi:transposase
VPGTALGVGRKATRPLEDALCKLTSVISRLAGHQTARAIIEAMIAGERDPRVLAAPGQGRMRNEKLPALAEALPGMRFGPQHAHAAASLLRSTGLLDAGLRDLQERVTAHLAAIPGSWAWTPAASPGRRPGRPLTRPCCRPRSGWTRSPAWAGKPPWH